MKWVIFSALTMFMPCIFYAFVVIGVSTMGAMLLDSVPGLINGYFSSLVFPMTHGLVYLPLFYLIARFTAKLLSTTSPERRRYAVTAIVIGLVMAGFLPIFGGGHNSYDPTSLYSGLFSDE